MLLNPQMHDLSSTAKSQKLILEMPMSTQEKVTLRMKNSTTGKFNSLHPDKLNRSICKSCFKTPNYGRLLEFLGL